LDGLGHEVTTRQSIRTPGWMNILWNAWRNTAKRNLSLVAGGVAYYLLMASFPALAALVSLYGLIANPADVARRVQSLSGLLPSSAVTLIGDELHRLVSASSKSLGLGAVIGIVIALWSCMKGMTGMMSALNIAYAQSERRGTIRFYTTGLLLTAVVIAGGLITLTFIVVLPAILRGVSPGNPARSFVIAIELPLLIIVVMGIMVLIYRYGPDHEKPKWKWASPGVVTAAILWIMGSALFGFYVHHFRSYNRTYGSLGALLVLLTWLWLSVFVVLLGAEINGEAERQLKRDANHRAGRI
jgi:membrane protein